MKQGTGNSRMGATKVEPKSRAMNVEAVADIGIRQVKHPHPSLDAGRGYTAPKASSSVHPRGSQGKH